MSIFDDTPYELVVLGEVVEKSETRDPRRTPDRGFQYVDISSVSNVTFNVGATKSVMGAVAPSRARKVIRENDVIFATTRPYLKSIARIPKRLDGHVCSTGFCVLRANERVVSDWLFYCVLSNAFMRQITPLMRGTNYPAVTDKDILAAKIPLPKVAEQQRIVGLIKDCMDYLEEMARLHNERRNNLVDLKRSLVLGTSREKREWCPIGEVVDWIQDTESVQPNSKYDFVGVKSFGKGLFRSTTRKGNEFSYASVRRLRVRDFIFPKLMAWEGAFGMVAKEFHGCVVSPEYVVFREKSDYLCIEVLDTYFRSPVCLEAVRQASTGSNRRRRRLNPKEFLGLMVPVPSAREQESLRAVYEFAHRAEEEWGGLECELDALRASILSKAFAGEL